MTRMAGIRIQDPNLDDELAHEAVGAEENFCPKNIVLATELKPGQQ